MIEKILTDLYKIEIPLPRNPLKALNSYLIKEQERCLIIDTGMNRKECKRQMLSALDKLNVDLNHTDFFITHLHVDHLGLVSDLVTDTSTVYLGQRDAEIVNSDKHWPEIYDLYRNYGFPENELKNSLKKHPARRYGLSNRIDFHNQQENDEVIIGDYSLRCVETPGHTPGHMCLYGRDQKILFSGDHILFDITPNITIWPSMINSLENYLASLEKVYPLDVDLILPGHRSIWNSHQERIKELLKHHQNRLNEVLSALEKEEKTAFQIAPHITWDVNYGSWELFPPPQKWFAVSETLAHLKFLEDEGKVRKRMKDDKIVYSLN